jgi:2-polyprenyl-6-hydroxyphenyl methylase/3-demethylubiquinone-9 3-methyltransferase
MNKPNKCKCCHSTDLNLLGNLDANRACWDRYGTRVFLPSEILLPYYSCINCGFIFTTFMDEWSPEDFKNKIYNEDYLTKVNPPLPEDKARPANETGSYILGKHLAFMLDGSQKKIKVLDYGAGSEISLMGNAFIDSGFDYYSYEPYLTNSNKSYPSGQFDFIFAIEVVEHCHNLEDLTNFIKEHLTTEGIFYIQTEIHPFPTPENILNSWYIAPRDGHISIFTFKALAALFRGAGINVVETLYGILAFKQLPNYPNKFFV